jgi:hypothetical protein
MKNLNCFIALLIVISFLSCSKDDNEYDENLIDGYYKIQSITSSIAVDLNGDSQITTDLKKEIDFYFFDDDNNNYDLEITSNFTNDRSISFYYPETDLSFIYPQYPKGYVDFYKKLNVFAFDYQNDKFLFTQSETDVVEIKTIELIQKDYIKSTVSKEYYDFEIENWRKLDIEIIYYKVAYRQ